MAATLVEQISVRQINSTQYESSSLPGRMGNTLPIAYGGCTLGVAINAASCSVPDSYNLYSALGHFLGPALIDRKLDCQVHKIRDTRTFSTRRVEVSQVLDNGETRLCLIMIADFHIKEPAMFIYSNKPSIKYSDVDQCPTLDQGREQLVKDGKLSEKVAKLHKTMFSLNERFFDCRPCPEGVSGQTLSGMAKTVPTTQDDLHITSKSSAEWFRSKHHVNTKNEQYGSLGFLMDGGLSFLPLAHNHMFVDDGGACSSLDFALRIMAPELDLNQWYIKERIASSADSARTYSEGRLWNRDGKLIASMTQQSILRPPKEQKPSL